MWKAIARVVLAAALFGAAGCHTVAWDSVAVPGSNQRLVVGAYSGFLQPTRPQMWVYEGGVATPVETRDESGGAR